MSSVIGVMSDPRLQSVVTGCSAWTDTGGDMFDA